MTSGLHKLCQPASLAVRKWRENEKKPYNLWQPAWHNETIVKQSFYRIHHLIWNLNNCFPYRSLYKVHQSLIEETLLWSPIQVLVRDSDWSSRIPHFVNWGTEGPLPVFSGRVSFGDTLYVGPFSFYVRLFSNLHRRTAQQKRLF